VDKMVLLKLKQNWYCITYSVKTIGQIQFDARCLDALFKVDLFTALPSGCIAGIFGQ